MALDRSDFARFFAELNGGAQPFSWQRQLMELIVDTGRWPDQIVAPTGAGKSSVVDVHLFVNALHAAGQGPRVPRRLTVVVNRRALVDNQAQRAKELQERFTAALHPDSGDSDIIKESARLLHTLTTGEASAATAFLVGHLRGQLVDGSLPVDDPSACAVIAATPDMFGSRLLFQGYGSSRYARPRETAILAMDNTLVLDEAHLNRQLLVTARRIAQLQAFEQDLGVPRLQVTETTATSAENRTRDTMEVVGVDPDDLDAPEDAPLKARVHSKKTLTLSHLPRWNGRPANKGVVNELIAQSLRLSEELASPEGHNNTIGCLVNHVDTAIQVTAQLRKSGLRVLALVGRMRPFDLDRRRHDISALQSPDSPSQYDVVVATQTLEVGVDVDFAGMVTDLAPGSALAQRFGRVNRRGEREKSEVVVIVPAEDTALTADFPPYAAEDLNAARTWLGRLSQRGSVNPAALAEVPPPAETPRRLLFQRPELVNLLNWSRTSDRLFAEDDLDLWLKDALEPERATAGVVVRHNLPARESAALELLKEIPPEDREVFPARLGDIQEVLDQYRRRAPEGKVFLLRNAEITLLPDDFRLHPGDVLVFEPLMPMALEGVIAPPAVSKDVPKEVLPDRVLSKTLHILTKDHIDGDADPDLLEVFAECTPEEATEIWHERGNEGNIILSATRTDADGRGRILISWFFAEDPDATVHDQETRQEWSPTRGRVDLEAHQQAVAERVDILSDTLSLAGDYRPVLHRAARLHDQGKSDPRFQSFLGKRENENPLAKSPIRNRQQLRLARQRSGLPQGWRHEQLSVVYAASDPTIDELTMRIIGCSHGRGRSGFPHTGSELMFAGADPEMNEQADRLFTVGEWDELMEWTTVQFGAYATSFLEALERAADAQISSEGK